MNTYKMEFNTLRELVSNNNIFNRISTGYRHHKRLGDDTAVIYLNRLAAKCEIVCDKATVSMNTNRIYRFICRRESLGLVGWATIKINGNTYEGRFKINEATSGSMTNPRIRFYADIICKRPTYKSVIEKYYLMDLLDTPFSMKFNSTKEMQLFMDANSELFEGDPENKFVIKCSSTGPSHSRNTVVTFKESEITDWQCYESKLYISSTALIRFWDDKLKENVSLRVSINTSNRKLYVSMKCSSEQCDYRIYKIKYYPNRSQPHR